jgi:hypothetical protein
MVIFLIQFQSNQRGIFVCVYRKVKPSVSHSLKTSDESGEEETAGTTNKDTKRSEKDSQKVIIQPFYDLLTNVMQLPRLVR